MNVSCRRVTAIPFVLSALLAACSGVTPYRDGVHVAEQLYPGAVRGDRGPMLVRIVDDLTGAPLAGAEVFQVAESETPIAGRFWWTRRGESDADGFVRIDRPNGDRDWHVLVVKHPSCGVATANARGTSIARVGRGLDVPVRILDWLGRPQPGAGVGFCGYCGHSPDLTFAIADGNGIAVLRGIDPHQDFGDLYVQHPGLHFFYNNVRWRPADPPAEVRCGYGPAQTGRVLDHRGEPVAGAFVCGGGRHRGPWAVTATDGTFTILGGGATDSPHKVVVGGRTVHFDAPTGVPVTLRLPDLADAKAYQGPVVPPRDAESPAPAPVPMQPRRVLVDDAPAEVRLAVHHPELTEEAVGEGDLVPMPVGLPFELTVSTGQEERLQSRRFTFPSGAPAEGDLRVRWLPAPKVRGRCVDAAGAPCVGFVRWANSGPYDVATGPDGTFVMDGPHAGWQVLEVRADADQAWRRHHLRVGAPGSADVDIGAVRVVGAAPLVVVGADGQPLHDAKVGFVRVGWHEPGSPEWAKLEADGSWFGAVLEAGDAVVVERDGFVPFRTLLQGSGPWRVAVPDGQLDFLVVGAAGERLTATVIVGDHAVAVADDGRRTLHGLPHGPTTSWVSAPGHRSAIVGAVVRADLHTVRVTLPAR